MKKSMILMCISAMLGLCIPATASEPEHTPPVKQEIRVVNENDLAAIRENDPPKEVTPVTSENGEESTSASSRHAGGYVVISGAGLLLIIILLILLL